ncbi:MAG: methyl-accepting chemotaxis protein [Opitutales bacterium]|jgi:methyl-accepting chemotaxis protein
MVAITLGVMTISINKDIDFGKWEAYGIVYQRPLEQILDLLPRYKDASAKFASGESTRDRTDLQARMNAAFDELMKAQDKVGEALQFTDQGLSSRQREAASAASLLREWKSISSSPAEDVAVNNAVSDMVGHVRMAITHSGDTSNLILDPDLDSYYLMDVTLCALPQTQDRLGSITLQVHDWLVAGDVSAHRTELAAMIALLSESDMARVEGDVQTVLNEDANFYGTSASLQASLPKATKSYLAANRELLAMLEQLCAGNAGPTPEEFYATAWRARDEALLMWNVSATELDQLLSTRIDAYRSKRSFSLLCIALALLFSALITWWFIRSLQHALRKITFGLQDNARQLINIAAQITSSSHSLADSSSEQASSIEETSASLEELASMSRCNVESAKHVTEIVHKTRQTAERGEGDMDGLAQAMTKLQSSSADIAKIVKTIDEIAFQTNILALNAAVEAARAGDAGLGFAVVADEVRSLAQRSAQAAKETSAQIEAAIAHATQGVKISTQVGSSLREIVEGVRQIDVSATEVVTASQEQSQGVGQINVAVGQMDTVTQSNAAGAEQSAAAAHDLNQQVTLMEDSVASIVMLVDGEAGQRRGTDSGRALTPRGPRDGSMPDLSFKTTYRPAGN